MSPIGVSAEVCLAIVAVAGPAALLAAGDTEAALQILPVSAGLSGAVVAALKAQLSGVAGQSAPDRFKQLLRFVATAGSGATAAVFGGPGALVLLGVHGVPVAMLVHFIVGLMGSAICDAVIGAGPWAGDQIVAGVKRAAGIPATAKPPPAETQL